MPSPTPSLIGRKAPPKAAAPAPAVGPLRWFRVKAEVMIPRKGSAPFLLKKGKEINSVFQGPDTLKNLQAAGAELEEIETPAWYVEAQAQARGTHEAMLAAGHDVGEVPPPYEAPKVSRAAEKTEPTS